MNDRDREARKIHDWFFQTAGLCVLVAVATTIIGEYVGAIIFAAIATFNGAVGVYFRRRWSREL